MQACSVFIGVDVAKAELVCAVHAQEGSRCVANESAAIKDWLRQLPAGACLAMESTGAYHQLLATLACAAGLHVFVLNARDVYFYAKALGARAKTDRLDAQVIARYLAEQHRCLRPWQPAHPQLGAVRQLLAQRALITHKRVALDQSLLGSDASLAQALENMHTAFAALLRAIDARIDALLAQDAQWSAQRQLLQSIVGVGPQCSALLASLLGQLEFANADALVAYSGLDPRASDSGRSRGKRRLSKRGPPALRRQMYLTAMSASHTATFKGLYTALRERGLSTTEALVVLARKLLRIALAVWRSGKPFDPQKVALPA